MNESQLPAEIAEASTPRQHLTWWVCRITPEGLLDPNYTVSYSSKVECERVCKELAFANLGTTYRPAKLGDLFVAKTQTTVVLA